MKTARGPALVLGLFYLFFLGFLALSSGQLPDRVATHFDGSGQPNGWMSRSSHLWFIYPPGHLSTPLLFAVTGGFLLALAVWAVAMIRHFRRVA